VTVQSGPYGTQSGHQCWYQVGVFALDQFDERERLETSDLDRVVGLGHPPLGLLLNRCLDLSPIGLLETVGQRRGVVFT
ncbi:uncharacterized protein METZ01_LOCUS45507, partial [marine metagenome]